MITTFDRQPHSLTYITPFLATFRENGGEQKVLKFQESGWPNSLLTLKIRLIYMLLENLKILRLTILLKVPLYKKKFGKNYLKLNIVKFQHTEK